MNLIHFTGKVPAYYPMALEIRLTVFVVEQSVPQELEQDEFDDFAEHYLMFAENIPVATCRVRQTQYGCKIERMCVLPLHRRKGIAEIMFNDILARHATPQQTIYLHAQEQVVEYYKKFQFKVVGKAFYEAGIRHFRMERVS